MNQLQHRLAHESLPTSLFLERFHQLFDLGLVGGAVYALIQSAALTPGQWHLERAFGKARLTS